MTTDYENQLEEEIISLKNLLDERTKELDAAKDLLMQWENGTMVNQPLRLSPGISVRENDSSPYTILATPFNVGSEIFMGGETFTAQDVANLKHLWSLHMTKMNNKPLLYRLWRKIISCLTMKKN